MNRSNLDFLRNKGKSDSNHVLTPKIKYLDADLAFLEMTVQMKFVYGSFE